ncbi:MAG: hypothetical protein U0Y08_08080 [Bacteroidia bacterium]
MSKNLFYFLICLGSCLGLASCDNEVDLLEDYREIPVIYGLINPSDTVQYVRVQKAYLGEGNALVMAQVADSIYYDPNQITLSLEKLTIGANTVVNTQTFSTTTEFPKEEGLFTDDGHYLFKLATPTGIDDNYYYRLRFRNQQTGKEVTATTRIIEPMQFASFNNSVKVNLANPNPYQIRFNSPKWGRVFGLIMRIKYNEYDTVSLSYETKYVDYKLKNVSTLGVNGGEQMTFFLKGDEIFRFMGSAIGPQQGSRKRVLNSFRADYLFTAGTDELYNYIQINSPANVTNYIPAFTNLSDGRGIFTCRYTTHVDDVAFNELTLDSILNGQYTNIIFK